MFLFFSVVIFHISTEATRYHGLDGVGVGSSSGSDDVDGGSLVVGFAGHTTTTAKCIIIIIVGGRVLSTAE